MHERTLFEVSHHTISHINAHFLLDEIDDAICMGPLEREYEVRLLVRN